jgi:hypothetical protein
VAKPPKDPAEPSRAETKAMTAAEKAKAARNARIERAVVVVSVVVGVIAAGVIWKKHHHGNGADHTVKALQDIGVTPFVAGCGQQSPTNDPVPEKDVVVPPGTKVKYPTVPPSAGPHLAAPVQVNSAGFYTAADRPPIEGLVANLNADWTVLWYDATALGPAQVALIKKAAGVLHTDKRYSTFVASEWDSSYGALPAGTPIALVRWTKTQPIGGHRAFCHEASGEAFLQYMLFYGAPVPPGEDG